MKKVLLSILIITIFRITAFSQNQIDSLLRLKTDSLEYLIQVSDDTSKINSFVEIIRLYLDVNSEMVFEYTDRLSAHSDKIKNKKGKAFSYYYKGLCYKNMAEYGKAYENNLEALALFQETKDSVEIAKTYAHIAICQTHFANYEKSIEFLDKAEDIYTLLGDNSGVITILGNKSVVYGRQAEYGKSLDIQKKILELSKTPAFQKLEGIHEDIARTLVNIAVSYRFLDDYINAEKYLFQGIQYVNQYKTYNQEAFIYLNLGQIKILKNQNDSSLIYFQKSINKAKKTEDRGMLMQAYESIAEAYMNKKDYQKCSEYLILFSDLYKEIYSPEKFQAINVMNSNLEIESKKKELKLAKAENDIKTTEISKKNILNIVLIISLVILVLSIVFFVYLYIGNEKANKILTQKNQELLNWKLTNIPSVFEKNIETTVQNKDSDDVLAQNLVLLMEKDKLFLDPSLSMTKIAGLLDVSANRVSKMVNTKFGKSFSEFINDYRVKEAQLMLSKDDQQYTMEYIADNVGFNYRTTFNIVFKKYTGVSPTTYRKHSLKSD